MLIILKVRKNKKIKPWAIGLGACFVIFSICIAVTPTKTDNSSSSTSTSSNSNSQAEEVKKTEEIEALQEKYKPLLEGNKIYEAMNDDERKTADDLISNWDKLEQEFKTSYQSQKDSISKSKDEYTTKLKQQQKPKRQQKKKLHIILE